MEKKKTVTQDAIRILVISIACLGGYFFSQVVIFGRPFESQTLIVGAICSFTVGVGFYIFQRRKDKKQNSDIRNNNDDIID